MVKVLNLVSPENYLPIYVFVSSDISSQYFLGDLIFTLTISVTIMYHVS